MSSTPPPIAWQTFLAMRPPTVTHNDLRVRRHPSGHHYIGKSDALLRAEASIEDRIKPFVPARPLCGKLRARVTWCFEPEGKHVDGEPMDTKPDLDNLAKTLIDCLVRCKVITDDAIIADEHLTKVWSEPCGIFVRVERI